MEDILTTPAALRRAAEKWPDRTAIIDGQWGAPVEQTWQELLDEARTFAAALVASGVKAGDTVAIWSPNSHHWPVAALGTQYAGGVLVPLNTRYTPGEAIEIICWAGHSRETTPAGDVTDSRR